MTKILEKSLQRNFFYPKNLELLQLIKSIILLLMSRTPYQQKKDRTKRGNIFKIYTPLLCWYSG
ncbi:hypothetical protein C4H11_06565 [Bacteroides zoogleoformans]|uniref:Uncharacterized protein n=1 Tax=Bacteroides zoogleoformans TaxID=28119 RepID=A0ABM6T7B3_9BACE|nr:hypothetical protein C4H11_06565 [Bacteroides zoogleoformans]